MSSNNDAGRGPVSDSTGESIWTATTPETDYPRVPEDDVHVDAAIVGGGIVGVTAARTLADAGLSVALLESDRIVAAVTGHSTAKLTSLHGLIYDHLLQTVGADRARRYGEANEAAIDEVERRVEEADLDADFERTPAYTYTTDTGGIEKIRDEVAAARTVGLPATYTESTPLPVDVEAAVKFEEQATFHPRAYLLALAEGIPGDGSHVFERTKALDVHRGNRCRVTTERGTIIADDVVVATQFPFYDRGLYFARLVPRRSYVLAVELAGDVPEGLHYRHGNPYFSVRPHPAGEESMVLVGGQNHRTGHGGSEIQHYRKLEREARSTFDVETVHYRWSTQDFASVDRVPFVGQLAPQTDHIYVATGFGGWGLTNGTAAGLILADLVRGKPNDRADVYRPTRLRPTASLGELVSHNKHAATHFVEDRLGRSKPDRHPPLGLDEATVVDADGDPLAVYRDEDGDLHAVSAVCSHMGCHVGWNDAEKTWDCPCHASRFDVDGSVIEGPATTGLSPRLVEAFVEREGTSVRRPQD